MVRMYRAVDVSETEAIAAYINDRVKQHPGIEVAIFLTQKRTFNLVRPDWPELKEKVRKRPFSFVGVYGAGITAEELTEDFETAIERYDSHMEYRKMLSRSTAKPAVPVERWTSGGFGNAACA